MRKRTVFYVLTIATILWVLFMFSILTSLGAENKNTSQMTYKEIKQREMLYNACLMQTGSTSYCYRLYY